MDTPLSPAPVLWRLSWIELAADRIVLHVVPRRRQVRCPSCRSWCSRVHSRYLRRAWDLPWGPWPVHLVVHTRRWFCDAPGCPCRIFTERFPDVLPRYARRTGRASESLLELAHSSSAEQAARVARLLGFLTSADTLLRLQRGEAFLHPPLRVVGIDEFAYRRGCTYGTLLVDLERRHPLNLLDDISTESVVAALRQHPQVTVVARDRAEAFAHAARVALPHTVQVADRFHLVRNVTEAFRELLRSRRWVPPAAPPSPPCPPPPSSPHAPTPRKRSIWETVHAHAGTGESLSAIARAVGVNRKTVRRYVTLDHPPAYPIRAPRVTKITPYLAYLQQRWAAGCQNAMQLYRELVARGDQGSRTQVKLLVRPWRSAQGPPRVQRLPHRLLLTRACRLTDAEQTELACWLQAHPLLEHGYRLKEAFLALVAQRDVTALETWLNDASGCGLPRFSGVARSFERDHAAVVAALTFPWSTGQVEGQITRLKLIKRIGYGRAKPDLLRQRVLHRMIV